MFLSGLNATAEGLSVEIESQVLDWPKFRYESWCSLIGKSFKFFRSVFQKTKNLLNQIQDFQGNLELL